MKIVHVIPAFTKGGAERVAVDLANHAAREGHEVTIVASFPVSSELLLWALSPDVAVKYVAPAGAGRAGRYLRLLPWLWANRRWLSQQDVIHCHLTYASIFGTLFAWLRPRASRSALVETYHAVGMPIPNLHRSFHAWLMKRRDAVVLMAEDDYWHRFLQNHPKIYSAVIPNGVQFGRAPPSLEERAAYRASLGLPVGAQVVGTVGRLVPARRPSLFVEVFAEIARTCPPDVWFFLGGEGPEASAVAALVAARGLEGRVCTPGMVANPLLAFSVIDLYLTLNVGAITGIAALEAVSAGLPLLAIQQRDDYKACPDDWIWSSADPGEVGARAAALLADPAALAELAANQFRYARSTFTIEAMAGRYSAVYRTAISAAAAPKRASRG
jgi:glycosyltransferase involved in cell wall biosynthesis